MYNRHFLKEVLEFVIADQHIDNHKRLEKVEKILRDYAHINRNRAEINLFNDNVFNCFNEIKAAKTAPLFSLVDFGDQLDYAVKSEKLPVVRVLLEAGIKTYDRVQLLEFLRGYDQNAETVKCYEIFRSSFSFPPVEKRLTVQEIITKIEEKIKQSQSKDTSFLGGLFRDTAFSTAQIKIAGELINNIKLHGDSLTDSNQLKGMVLTEFAVASRAFCMLANAKTNKDGGASISRDAEGNTRFHATIKALSQEIEMSEVDSMLVKAERSIPVTRVVAPLQEKNTLVLYHRYPENHFLIDRLSLLMAASDDETRVKKLEVILPHIVGVRERLDELKEIERYIYNYHKNDNNIPYISPELDAVDFDINKILSARFSALSTAVHQKDRDAVNVLLDFGADPNLGDGRGLFIAVVLNDASMMQLLINAKVNINQMRELDLSYYNYSIIDRDLYKRCDGKIGHYEHSVLMIASRLGHQDCVALLLEKGADLELVCGGYSGRKTALDFAIEGRCLSIVCMLLNKGAKINKPVEFLEILHAQDQDNELVQSCYGFLAASFSSSPELSKKISIDDIISIISEKIKESKANDFGFLTGHARIYEHQIGIAENLQSHIKRYNCKITDFSQLKGMILLELEKALEYLSERYVPQRSELKLQYDDVDHEYYTRIQGIVKVLMRSIKNSTVIHSVVKEMEASVGDVGQVSKGGIFSSARVAPAPPQANSDNDNVSNLYNNAVL